MLFSVKKNSFCAVSYNLPLAFWKVDHFLKLITNRNPFSFVYLFIFLSQANVYSNSKTLRENPNHFEGGGFSNT